MGKNGGQGGIRTHGTITSTPAFQASSFDHSDTCPYAGYLCNFCYLANETET